MSFEQLVRGIEADLTARICKLLSPTKKNIVFFCPTETYYKQFGTLPKKLAQKHHVILAKALPPMPADFEAQFASIVSVGWLVNTPEGKKHIQIDIPEIDIIISVDFGEGIQSNFLSKTAKRIYMPHSMLQAPNWSPYDYIIAPTKIFVEDYKRIHPNHTNQLILGGYPKFDSSLAQTSAQEPDRITFAPTLRNQSQLFITSLCAGYDANLLEWLLENTDQKIAYRPHPVTYSFEKVSKFYELLKYRFANESRLIFDESPGSGFYAQTQMLITDFSTTAYTFSLSTLRPSIFFAPLQGDRIIGRHIHRIGYAARNFQELKQILNKNEDKSQEIAAFREECVFNIGRSEEAICEAIDSILCS